MVRTSVFILATFCHTAASACWQYSESIDPMTDRTHAVASCLLDDGYGLMVSRLKSGEHTLAIAIRKHERFMELPMLRIDDAPAFNLRDTRFKARDTGPAVINMREMVIWRMNPEQLQSLRNGKRLLVRYRNLAGDANLLEFDLTGADEHIARIP